MRISRGGSNQPQNHPQPHAPPPGPPPKMKQPNPPHVKEKFVVMPGPPQGQPPQQLQMGQPVPLGANNIALPTPNYQYSYIGPNNQSLLSSNTLHNKLRVIEKIQ